MNNLLFIIFIFFISCSHQNKEINHVGTNLDLDEDINKPLPKIKNNKTVGPIGPVPSFETIGAKVKDKREPILALIISEAGLRSFGVIPFLKLADNRNLKFHIIGGYGMASIIAYYYSRGYSADLIEWNFYNLINKVDSSFYSKTWFEQMSSRFLSKNKNDKIEQGKYSLFIPLIKNSNREIVLKKRGKVSTYFNSKFLMQKGGRIYSSSANKTVFPVNDIKSIGADIVICVDTIGESQKWKKPNEYWYGRLNLTKSILEKEKEKCDLSFSLSLEDYEIDNRNNIAEIIKKSFIDSEKQIESVAELIKHWKEN